jgi:hypothetical protein
MTTIVLWMGALLIAMGILGPDPTIDGIDWWFVGLSSVVLIQGLIALGWRFHAARKLRAQEREEG